MNRILAKQMSRKKGERYKNKIPTGGRDYDKLTKKTK